MREITITKNNALELLSQVYRDAINIINDSTDNGRNWMNSLSSRLKMIQTRKDWFKLCAAMDLIGDTEKAKNHFKKFQLDGPTKYHDLGEKFLRLYGILNALYLQRESLIQLSHYSGNNNREPIRTSLDSTKAMWIRNVAGAHTLDTRELNGKNPYMIVRIGLKDSEVHVYGQGGELTVVNIQAAIEEFDTIIISELVLSIQRLLLIIPDTSEEKNQINTFIKHVKAMLEGEKYINSEDGILYTVGMHN